MDYKIFVGTSLNNREKIVSKDLTVRELLTENNLPFQDGQVTLNGGVLGTKELNSTLAELNISDGDYILTVSKQANGNLALIN